MTDSHNVGNRKKKTKQVNPQIFLYLLRRMNAAYPKQKLGQITTIKFKRITQTHKGEKSILARHKMSLNQPGTPNTERKGSGNVELVGG